MMATLDCKQYIGHARHDGPYPENSIDLYRYLVEKLNYKIIEADVVFTLDGIPVLNHGTTKAVHAEGRSQEVNINEMTYQGLLLLLEQDETGYLSTADEYVKFGKEHGVIVMLDVTFQDYTFSHYKTLYTIVSKCGMDNQVIWGDANILKLARLNRHLIVQVGGSWGRKLLLKSVLTSFFCKTTIMSFSYYGGNVESFQNIVKWGHRLGFVMKVATINNVELANRFWKIGTDLINTDTLLNTK